MQSLSPGGSSVVPGVMPPGSFYTNTLLNVRSSFIWQFGYSQDSILRLHTYSQAPRGMSELRREALLRYLRIWNQR